MKILQINNCHYRRGGADAVYLNTIKLLRENGNNVIEFSQLNANNEKTKFSEFFINNYDPINLSLLQKILKFPRLLYSIESKNKFEKLLVKNRPDIAHIHLYKSVLTASILPVLKKYGIPTCITLHDYSLLCPRNILFDGENRICEKCIAHTTLNCIVKRCNRKNLFYSVINFLEFNINNKLFKPKQYFEKIIPVSKFNYNKHSARKDIKEKLVHLYNFFPGCETTLPNNKKGVYFLFFGRLSLEKGLNTLFTAFGKNTNQKLIVVGTGPQEEELKSRIELEKLTNIEMLGYKTGEELESIIKNCSFVIVPSEWYENNPMTIVEGYSYGKPVIGSKVGGIPELIVENKTGFTFEMGNVDDLAAKLQLASNLSEAGYAKMSNHARDFALENFSEKTHYEKLMEIYIDMIKNYKNEQ